MIDWTQVINDSVVCPHCGRIVAQGRVARYEHDSCEREEREPSEGIRRLHLDTAAMLRRKGFPVEAEWHERRAGQ